MSGELRRVVLSPEGARYEVLAKGKEWKLGTGSVLLDAVALVWAVVRRTRGKEWVVTVRHADIVSDPLLTRLVATREDAASSVSVLSERIESGQLS